jgi:hypothetical protein
MEYDVAKIDPTELSKLLGSPPLLRSEKAEDYEAMLSKLATCLATRDPLELLLVKDVIDETWAIIRIRRCSALSIRHRAKLQNKIEDHRTSSESYREAEQEWKEEINKSIKDEAERGVGLLQLECSGHDFEFAMNLQRVDFELVEARALEYCIDHQEKLNGLVNDAFKRRNEALRQFEWYRCTLARHLRETSDEVIDAQFEDVDVASNEVPLIPSKE